MSILFSHFSHYFIDLFVYLVRKTRFLQKEVYFVFWEIFIKLCADNNTKPNPVAAKLGISSGAVTKWKNGVVPNSVTLHKIADFFGVSVEYLLGKEIDTSEDAELNNYLQELRTRPEMRMLFNLAKGATKSDVEKAVKIIETIIQD